MDRPDEKDFDRYIPAHLQENYEQIVAERHNGDWSALGRQMAVDGNDTLSRWAYSKASDDARSEPPRRRSRTPREVT